MQDSATAPCVAANNCFSPNPLYVSQGTTVTWRNTDTVSHYVTSGKSTDATTGTIFDSGNLIKPGGTYQFTFATAGAYNYYCTVHPWMTGQVIVGLGTQPTYQNGQNSNLVIKQHSSTKICDGKAIATTNYAEF